VKDISATWEFYRTLGFSLAGGSLDQGWGVLHNGGTEIGLFQGMMPENIINFRGSHIQQLAAELKQRGFTLESEAQFEAGKYPPEWSQDSQGNELPADGSGSFSVFDPGGICLFFDTVPVERAAFQSGAKFSFEALPNEMSEGLPPLGDCTICFSVEDVAASAAFYERLGMVAEGGAADSGYVIFNVGAPRDFRIGLYHNSHISEHLINFRGADVFATAERLRGEGLEVERGPERESDGSDGLWLRDPDRNLVYFNTAPGERKY
jgi:catechol 2,3-dioxygenase-like lactoylglutathione lyase family enzyme